MSDMKDMKDVNEYLAECVRIDPLALQEEYIRLPADYAYWAEHHKQVLERHLFAKAERERVWAMQYIIESERVHPTTGKPVSVDYIKAMIETADSYRSAVHASIVAEAEVAGVKGNLEAIRTKRESLISLGATVRQEMQHDPLVRERAANDRMYRDNNHR